MATRLRARDAMQFINEQDTATLERFIERLEYRGTDPTFAASREAYLKLVDLPPDAAVLDLGCGTGVVARALAARDGFAGTVTGVDQSPEFIEAARRLAAADGVGDRVGFVLGDAHALALPAASFDVAVAHTLVSHVRDPLAVLAEAARVIRPGGWLAVFDGDYGSLTFGSADPGLGQAMERAIQSTIMSSPRVMRELPRLLPKAGLQPIATQAHVYAEAGSSRFMLNLAETYAPMAASTGLVPAADVEAWLADQRRSAEDGTFFAACNTTPTWRAELHDGAYTPWGMLAAIDLHGCARDRLADPDAIRRFVPTVIDAIGMRAHGVLAVLVGIADTVPYVRDTLRGATRPHRGTWLIWSVLAIVVCLSQRADGATWSLLMAGAPGHPHQPCVLPGTAARVG